MRTPEPGALSTDILGAYIACVNGGVLEALGEMIDSLYPYLAHYGNQQIDVLDREYLSTLRRMADGISKIIDAENGS